MGDKISWLHISRSGLDVHTNEVSSWSQITDRIEGIDTGTAKAVRKTTTGLSIIDPEKYNMSPESMLVIRDAIQPLIYAAYENHHTRELSTNADAYIIDKTSDVYYFVKIWKKYFPELTEQHCESLVCFWLKRILLPKLYQSCTEKITFYKEQIRSSSVSKNLKTILTECLGKNEGYIKKFDELSERPDIVEKSSIFYPVP